MKKSDPMFAEMAERIFRPSKQVRQRAWTRRQVSALHDDVLATRLRDLLESQAQLGQALLLFLAEIQRRAEDKA